MHPQERYTSNTRWSSAPVEIDTQDSLRQFSYSQGNEPCPTSSAHASWVSTASRCTPVISGVLLLLIWCLWYKICHSATPGVASLVQRSRTCTFIVVVAVLHTKDYSSCMWARIPVKLSLPRQACVCCIVQTRGGIY